MSQSTIHTASAEAVTFDPAQPSQLPPDDDAGKAPDAADAANSAVRKPNPGIKRAVLVAGLACLGAAGWMGWQRLHSVPEVSPLEATAAMAKVPVPQPGEMAKPKLKESPPPSASAQGNSVDPAAGEVIEAVVGLPSTVSPAGQAVADTPAALRTALNTLIGRANTLEASDRANAALVQEHANKLAELRREIDLIKGAAPRAVAAKPASPVAEIDMSDTASEPAQAQRAAAPPVRRTAAAKPARQAPTSTGGDASVLAVDLWGGQPSVAVARTGAAGTELRFLNEGESQGRVTLKRADIASQNATFVTPGGERTFAPRER